MMIERDFDYGPDIRNKVLSHQAADIDPDIWKQRQDQGVPIEYEDERSIHFPLPDQRPGSNYRRPPLIVGSIEHIRIHEGDGWSHFGLCPMDPGRTTSHKGLESMVRLRENPKVYLIDNHNWAFFAWAEALKEGLINPGAYLIHVDDHSDTDAFELTFDGLYKDPFDLTNLSMMADFAETVIEVQNFIEPAVRSGIISSGEVLWVCPPNHRLSTLGWHEKESSFASRHYNGVKHYKDFLKGEVIEEIIEGIPNPKGVILDIDLDYFVPMQENPQMIRNHIEILRELIELAGCVTIASSPGYMDQSWAVQLAHELLS